MPPKNRISVARKSHIPSVEDSRCCAGSSKWCFSSGGWESISLLVNRHLLRIIVGGFGHDGRFDKVEGRRRRRAFFPLEALGLPGILWGNRTVAPGPGKINHRDQIADAQDRRAGGGHHIECVELRRIRG